MVIGRSTWISERSDWKNDIPIAHPGRFKDTKATSRIYTKMSHRTNMWGLLTAFRMTVFNAVILKRYLGKVLYLQSMENPPVCLYIYSFGSYYYFSDVIFATDEYTTG